MTEGSMGVWEEKEKGWGGWGGGIQNNHTHSHLPHQSLHPHIPAIPPPLSPPINRSENMSDWIFSSKSSGFGFCLSTPCQHPLKQPFNAPTPAIFTAKYVVRGREVRGKNKKGTGGKEKEVWRVDKNLQCRLIPVSSTLINCMLDRSSSSLSLFLSRSLSLSSSLLSLSCSLSSSSCAIMGCL